MNTKRIIFITSLGMIAIVSLAGYILFGHERLKAPVWSLSTVELEVEGMTREFSYYAPGGGIIITGLSIPAPRFERIRYSVAVSDKL